MKQKMKLMYVLLSLFSLAAPLGIAALTPVGSTTIAADSVYPATEYNFENRRSPIDILVYTEYADTTPGGEWDHSMITILSEYGPMFEYDNLTDYTQLENKIEDYDILLIVEQESATFAQMDTVSAAWNSFITAWVSNGGIIICMDYYSDVQTNYGPTLRILNNTNLMKIFNVTDRALSPVTITTPADALVFDVNPFTATGGTLGFDTIDAIIVAESGGQTVMAHRILGLGHVVAFGFDRFSLGSALETVLANAIRLTRHVVFDNSHGQTYNPLAGFYSFGYQIQLQHGFAITTMNTWDAALIESCDILVAANGGSSPIPYSPSEVDFIKGFVTGGGGLLIITDWGQWGNNTDSLLGGFGFARNYTGPVILDTDENGGDPAQPIYGHGNIANHSTTFRVDSLQMFYGNAFITKPTNAVSLVWTDSDGTENWAGGGSAAGLPLAASLHYGAGRVIALADGDFLSDSNNDGDATSDIFDEDNEYFAAGIIIWLSAAGIREKTVLFDNSKIPAVPLVDFHLLARFLTINGFNFMWMDQFLEGLIDQVDVLIMPDGTTNYTAGEISIVVDFVSDGGSLFVFADHTIFCQQVNPVVVEFGMEYNQTAGYILDSDDYISATSYIIFEGNNIANHPIMTGVERIELDLNGGFVNGGTPLLTTDTDGTATWTIGGEANGTTIFGAATFNRGRVVAIADYNLAGVGDFDGDNYEQLYDSHNDIFLANAFYWLVENRAPTVEVTYPNGGEVLNGTHIITWDSLDIDSDLLAYTVYVTDNNGSDWTLLVGGLTGTSYTWNTTLYDDGNDYMIRVVASDGMLTGQDASDAPFSLDNYAGTPPVPFDPMLLVIIGAGVAIVIIILVVFMKRGGTGKK